MATVGGGDDASLAVVIPTVGEASVTRTVTDVLASAEEAAEPVDVIVVWQAAASPPPFPAGVTVVETFPVGVAYARNRGLTASRAPLVAYVDADEAVDRGWVGALLATFQEHPDAAGVLGAVAPLDTDGIPYCEVSGESPRVFRRRSTPPWVVGTGGNMAFRRDDLLAIGAFDVAMGPAAPGRAAEESDVMARLMRRGRPLVWTPTAVVFHPTKTPAQHLASRRPYGFGAGALTRRRHDTGLGARYATAICQSYVTGVRTRDRQRRREASRTALGFVAGLASTGRARSPLGVLERMPAAVRTALGAAPIRALPARYDTQPEFRYAAGDLELLVLPGMTEPPPTGETAVVTSCAHRDAWWLVRKRRRR